MKATEHAVLSVTASRTRGVEPELAFLGGLLHDIGKIVILCTVAEIKRRTPDRKLSQTSLHLLFDSLHCRIGEGLFEAWKLPTAIRDIVRDHHSKDVSAQPQHVLVVMLANQIAARLGVSLRSDASIPPHESAVAVQLGLAEPEIAELLDLVRADVERARETL